MNLKVISSIDVFARLISLLIPIPDREYHSMSASVQTSSLSSTWDCVQIAAESHHLLFYIHTLIIHYYERLSHNLPIPQISSFNITTKLH